jgi:hypothetical protein
VARLSARLTATVVLPVPPLPLAMASLIERLFPDHLRATFRALFCGAGLSGNVRFTMSTRRTDTLAIRPGSCPSHSSWALSLSSSGAIAATTTSSGSTSHFATSYTSEKESD